MMIHRFLRLGTCRYHGQIEALAPIEFSSCDLIQSTEEKPLLNQEQSCLLQKMQLGYNIYFTGRAGTGKSEVLRQFIEESRKQGRKIGVLAPTGIAAANIGGQTIHSFAGFHQFDDLKDLTSIFATQKNIRNKFDKHHTLIIDEASMVTSHVFEALHHLIQIRRNSDCSAPFKGLQIILCGDFYQLPPIYKYQESIKYIFDTNAWTKLVNHGLYAGELQQVHRQKDADFLDILEEIRHGTISNESYQLLMSTRNKTFSDGIEATRICAYRNSVNEYNNAKLNLLDGSVFHYDALDTAEHNIDPSIPVSQDHEDFNDFTVDPTICFKVGAQVILMKNIQRHIGLVNGSRGIIEDFVLKEDPLAKRMLSLPLVRFTNGRRYLIGYQEFIRDLDGKNLRLIRHQLPLKLGWAITVHKAQGMTLERAEMDLPRLFSPGQAYVALSRAKSLDGLIVRNLSRNGIFCNPRVAQFYQELWRVSKSIHDPVQKSISL